MVHRKDRQVTITTTIVIMIATDGRRLPLSFRRLHGRGFKTGFSVRRGILEIIVAST
jgi:hypothetical protein